MSVKDEEMLRPMVEMSRLLFPVSVSASHDHSGNGAALVKIQYIVSWEKYTTSPFHFHPDQVRRKDQ